MESLVPPHHNLHFRYHFPHLPRPPSGRRRHCQSGVVLRAAVVMWVVPFLALTTFSTISCSPPSSQPAAALPLPVRATLLCDNSTFHECVQHAQLMTDAATSFSLTLPSSLLTISLNVSVARIPSDGPEALRTLSDGGPGAAGGEGLGETDVFVAVGSSRVVETATVLARGLDTPLLGYVDSDSWKNTYKPLTTEDYLSANADPVSQGATLALLVGQFNMPHTYILIQDIFLGSGFLEGFRSKGDSQYRDSFLGQSTLGSHMTDDQIDILLEELSLKSWKVIVLHCQPHLTLRVVQQSVAMNLFATGHGWFLSETAMTYDPKELRQLPVGLLGVRGFYHNSTRGLLQASARTISCAYACMQECFRDTLLPVPSSSPSSSVSYNFSSSLSSSDLPLSLLFKRSSSSSDIWSSSSSSSSSASPLSSWNVDSISLRGKFRVTCNDTTQYFTKCVRYSPICQQQQTDSKPSRSSSPTAPNSSSKPTPSHPHSSQHSSSSSILQSGTAYHLLTLVHNGPDERMWESVGFISANGQTNLKTVMWPGRTIFSPSSVATKTYRVVTRAARPFVYVEGPVTSEDECFTDVPCLQLHNSSKPYVVDSVHDFVSRRRRRDTDYSIYCCKGISLEILKKLSEDLNFQYVIYLVNNSNYGDFHNNTWSGMVGDVVSGSADLIVGAFSVTSSRMQAISFTEPYYQNDFSLVTGEDGQTPSMWAFLSPFSAQVWTCILLSSVVAGVATSSLEWFSPFGLNPRGRKRNKQYSLGSGLLMVWVLVTGHTINIKAPKSWPSKVIQNVWAGLAIFIMTSYTANLAAYLAGQSAVISVKSIFDSKLLHKRVSVIKSTAVEHLLQQINPDLYFITRNNYVNSTEDGIRKLLLDQTDVFLDDYELLEYEVSRNDNDCKIQFVGKGFGSDGYAIGLPKNSWMRAALSDKILQYTETGFIQELSKKYLIQSRCGYFLSGSAVQYGLEHTGGLFIILLSAVVISFLLLVLEHLAYKFLIPWFRSRPACSFWKTENMAFFSQRVHRVVRSERLYSQKQAAQEMITIVKQRDFTRLIQKHELQKRKILPQKRVKTKAEMFQEITANIVSFHRQLKEPDMMTWANEQCYAQDQDGGDAKEVNGDKQDGDLVAYDVVQDRHGLTAQTLAPPTIPEENHVGVNNLAYFPDAEPADYSPRADSSNSRSEGTDDELDACRDDDSSVNLDPEMGVVRLSPSKRGSRTLWSSPRRKHSVASAGGSSAGSRDLPLSSAVIGASASEPNSPEPREPWGHPVKPGRGKFHSPQHRRESDISPVRLPSNRPIQNNSRSRSQDYQNWDYFQKNLKLKENRIKSPSSRSHVLAAYQSQIPSGCLDYSTLQAMSKEDLLLLWKQSELELQTKLNDVHNRNKRLALAIDYLTKQEEGELIGEEV